MALFKRGGAVQEFPTVAREVYDVTGAGDTVLAACALALGAGGTLEEATVLANHAAGWWSGRSGPPRSAPTSYAPPCERGGRRRETPSRARREPRRRRPGAIGSAQHAERASSGRAPG